MPTATLPRARHNTPVPLPVASSRSRFHVPSAALSARDEDALLADTLAILDDVSAHTLADGEGDPLNEWFVGLTVRLSLQSEITWSGLQDGYRDAGAVARVPA